MKGMNMRHAYASMLVVLLSVTTGACARSPQAPDPAAGPGKVGAVQSSMQAPSPGAELPLVVVSKTAGCDCCRAWVEHMRSAGFAVQVRDMENLDAVKTRVGVPADKRSCHTAEVDGYFIEGHVPAGDVKRLLAERPKVRGLVVPGMPAGSPGMELPDGTTHPYTVEAVADDGSTRVFAHHGN
jgi:hypothetical protein